MVYTKEDIKFDELKESVAQVLRYSQHIPEQMPINIDDLMDNWFTNKSHFIDALGTNLRYGMDIDIKMNDDDMMTMVHDFIATEVAPIGNGYLTEFFNVQARGIADNRVVEKFYVPWLEETIPTDMKLGKAIHRYFQDIFTDEEQEKEVDDMLKSLAMLIQNKSVRGKLYLSVHPLDFLSISENTLNWRSCHALDGEYRCGNLNYIGDNCTFISYLVWNDEMVKLPNFPFEWNNKAWRCLLFTDPARTFIWAGRQYPNFRPYMFDTLSIILDKFECFDHYNYSEYIYKEWIHHITHLLTDVESNTTFELNRDHLFYQGRIVSLTDLVENEEDTTQYNDLLYSSCYTPYIYSYRESFPKKHRFKIGKPFKCICCGRHTITDSNSMVCEDCWETHHNYSTVDHTSPYSVIVQRAQELNERFTMLFNTSPLEAESANFYTESQEVNNSPTIVFETASNSSGPRIIIDLNDENI